MGPVAAECLLHVDGDRHALHDCVAREMDRIRANGEVQLTAPDVDRLARDRAIRDRRLGRDPHLRRLEIPVQRHADAQVADDMSGCQVGRDPHLASIAEWRVIDQVQRLLKRTGESGADLELSGVAALDADARDDDGALVHDQIAHVAARDREVHALAGERRAAIDTDQRRHGIEVSHGEILENELAGERVLWERLLAQLARAEPYLRARRWHRAVRDVLEDPGACLPPLGRRPEARDVIDGDVLRLHICLQRRNAPAPRYLAPAAQVRAVGGEAQLIDDDPLEIRCQRALNPKSIDRQLTEPQPGQFDDARLCLDIKHDRLELACRRDGAPRSATERKSHARERQIRREVREFGWQQILEGEVDVHPVLARLVAC